MLMTKVPAQNIADETTEPQNTEENIGIAYQLEKSKRNNTMSVELVSGPTVTHLYLQLGCFYFDQQITHAHHLQGTATYLPTSSRRALRIMSSPFESIW